MTAKIRRTSIIDAVHIADRQVLLLDGNACAGR